MKGANVSIKLLSSGAVSEAGGSYRIEEVDILEFEVKANALNYLASSYNLSISQAGLVTVDFKLTPALESPLEITSVTLEQASYQALDAAYMDVVLNNQAATAQSVQLSIKVVNENQQIIEQTTPVINSLVTVEANSPLSTRPEWQTAKHPAGDYHLIVQAFDENNGRLLAEQGTSISIEPTHQIGGHVAFTPPIAQLAAKKPVKITAQIANQGNQSLEASTLTATLSLKNQGYQQRKSEFSVEPFVLENELFNNPRGVDRDAAGNFYVASQSNHSILKITPEGTVSEFATDLYYPIDVDLDQHRNVFVLGPYHHYNKSLVRLEVDGSRTEIKFIYTGSTRVSSLQALEVLDDERILIAADSALYVATLETNNTANLVMLAQKGLNGPRGLVADSQGNLFIADYKGNAVVKFAGNGLSTLVTGIGRPSGITIDADDNLYVTSFSGNNLFKITPDGQKSLITDDLAGPYDVKIAPDGNFVVSNYSAHEILNITPTGEVSVRVPATTYQPRALTYDADNHLYIGNQGYGNIIKIVKSASGDTVTRLADRSDPRDLLTLDDRLCWLEFNSLSTKGLDDSAKTTLTSELKNPYAFIHAPEGDGFLVSEYAAHQISQVSTDGEITPYTKETLFSNPHSLRQDNKGQLYLLSDNGYITQFKETGEISRVISGLDTSRGLAIDHDGNLIVSEYNKKRLPCLD